jgi:glucose/arabinose dehydrogenase
MNSGSRALNARDIALPDGFAAEVFLKGLTTPIDIEFADDGSLYIGDAGIVSGNGKVLRAIQGGVETVADGFNPPLTGLTLHNGKIFVSHRGYVTAIHQDGSAENVIGGLPSWGDHHNNKAVFGPDGRMYFGQGTATNSAVVGLDNASWVRRFPYFHDYPGSSLTLAGENFTTPDVFANVPGEKAVTGSYAPFGVPVFQGQTVNGIVRASGSILSANEDGSDLRSVAWGLRNPFRLAFDRSGRLLATNHGMDVRGSRPVANSPDEFHYIAPGAWYGWPDFTGGLPVVMPQFKPADGPQPRFVLANHPMIPPKPFAAFAPHSAIMGFDFNYGASFPGYGNVYIAEFGSQAPAAAGGAPAPDVGHRVSVIEMDSGNILAFAMNRSGAAASRTGEGGFERPIDARFGPDGALYVADFGAAAGGPDGVVWRIARTQGGGPQTKK